MRLRLSHPDFNGLCTPGMNEHASTHDRQGVPARSWNETSIAFRARNVGFIFQMFHLVPYLNVLDNVLLCTHGNGDTSKPAAVELLERLELSHRAGHKPSQLSTGERQRTAIARATLLKPSVLLADEPTGNLDEENAAEVVKILGNYRDEGGTVLVVTHGSDTLEYADRVIRMRAGRMC